MSEPLTVRLTGEAMVQVIPEVTARRLGSGTVSVFATPEMVRLMERAAVNALKP
jgi:predicted thioesterase